MAPTICSDKKRQLRAGHGNDMRRHHASVRSSTVAAAAATTAHMTNPASTIINYVAKGALNSRTAATLRVRSTSVFHNNGRRSSVTSHSRSDSDEICRERLLERGNSFSTNSSSSTTNSASQQQQQQLSQISDEMVSSSTHDENSASAHNTKYQHITSSAAAVSAYRRSASPISSVSGSTYQYSSEEDTIDPEDAEVHSINSGGKRNAEDNGGDTDDSVGRQQLLRCSLKTVFNAHAPPLSDKHQLALCDSNSKTYSNMCEIKNTEGLLAIAIKTIKLVKRNQMLQRRLAQLQLETSEFIQSVLANPENRHFREKMQTKERI